MEYAKLEIRAKLFAHIKRENGLLEERFLSDKVVTSVGVDYIVDSFQDSVSFPLDAFKNHAIGVGTNAESVGDTTLQSEVGTRELDAGPAEGASSNIFRTVGSFSFTSSLSITEHGVLSALTGGVLLDRSVFTAVPVNNGDAVDFIYEITLTAGG